MAVCGKPVEAIHALAERKRENEDTARVRFRVGTRGEDGVIRHPSGIPTFSARSADEGLVLVQVRRAFLQVHRPSIRVESEPDVVYSTNGTHGSKSKATVSSSRALGRLPGMPRQSREGSQSEGLPEGYTSDRQAALIIRLDTASDEGGMGREDSGGTPWLRDRLGSHAFLHSPAKDCQGTWYRAGYPPASTARAAVGFEGQVTIVLWCVHLIVAGNALCSLLHQESIRRHDQKAQGGSSIKEWESLPVESSVDKGPADVEEIGEQRDKRTPNSTAPNNGIMHTDAADMGFGGTLDIAGNPGDPGQWQDQGIWEWKDGAECISVRKLKAIRMFLMGTLGERVKKEGITLLRLCVDNSSVVHVTNAFVASSRPMMREHRRLKKVLDELGLQLSSEWIPSVTNKFADALSRRFSPGDLAVRQMLRRSVVDGMMAPLD
jgi:hypothetical protein